MEKKSKSSARTPDKRTILIISAVILATAVVIALVILLSHKPAEKAPAAPSPTVAPLDESLLHGEPAKAELFTGTWISYANGSQLTYTYDDDGCAIFRHENGSVSEYHYEIQDDRVIQTRGDKRQVYIWSPVAITFFTDRTYGESSDITYQIGERIGDFAGFMYVKGDYLFIGRLCMCREEAAHASDGNTSLEGVWTGTSGDRVTFTADGQYHYREKGVDYDGTYSCNEAEHKLYLTLEGEGTSVLSDTEWGIDGRVLHLQSHYYFRDPVE